MQPGEPAQGACPGEGSLVQSGQRRQGFRVAMQVPVQLLSAPDVRRAGACLVQPVCARGMQRAAAGTTSCSRTPSLEGGCCPCPSQLVIPARPAVLGACRPVRAHRAGHAGSQHGGHHLAQPVLPLPNASNPPLPGGRPAGPHVLIMLAASNGAQSRTSTEATASSCRGPAQDCVGPQSCLIF